MVASARVAHLATRGRDYGTEFKRSSLVLNMETVRKRKREIVESFRTGGENRLKSADGLDLIMGKAKFTGPKELSITHNDSSPTSTLTADLIIINAGCSPAPLTAKNAHAIPYLTSTTIMELDKVPTHLGIIGGGYIGVEFAQMFRRFGAKVSIIQRGSRVLANEDEDVSEEMTYILRSANIEIYTNATPIELSQIPTGQKVIGVRLGSGETKSIVVSHILAAGGRVPNTSYLDLSAAGIETDAKGFIKVSPTLETSVPGVYAIGDIKGGPQFTHISFDDYRILTHNLLSPSSQPPSNQLTTTNRLVPYTVFTDPQLGRVGHTHASALRAFPNKKILTAKMPMSYVARALENDETKGFMKAVVDAESKQILGFACLGIEGGEVMSMVQIAMMGGLGYDRLRDAVFAHPCLSESLNNLWGFLE
jgi:pyruvate/2-oxoglutarate dehydrogenase complex dihydrolipoamide dehydrogenase (E3) component